MGVVVGKGDTSAAPQAPDPRQGMRLVVAYDGSDFAGFQVQPRQRTVQGELERVIANMAGHPITVRGAGRTDAGVHALGQVVAFASERHIEPRGWRLGLNRTLPDDIRVQRADTVAPRYNPRFDALGKHYRYLVHVGLSENPLLRKRAWYVGAHTKVDFALAAQAAQSLVGSHDFAAFRASNDACDTTRRTLTAVDLTRGHGGDTDLWVIDVRGTAFLKNMVRIIAGTLVDIGRGQLPPDRIEGLLSGSLTRHEAGQTAPAHGLALVEVQLGRESVRQTVPDPASAPEG